MCRAAHSHSPLLLNPEPRTLNRAAPTPMCRAAHFNSPALHVRHGDPPRNSGPGRIRSTDGATPPARRGTAEGRHDRSAAADPPGANRSAAPSPACRRRPRGPSLQFAARAGGGGTLPYEPAAELPESLTKSFGARPLFRDISISFDDTERTRPDRPQRLRQVHAAEDPRRPRDSPTTATIIARAAAPARLPAAGRRLSRRA